MQRQFLFNSFNNLQLLNNYPPFSLWTYWCIVMIIYYFIFRIQLMFLKKEMLGVFFFISSYISYNITFLHSIQLRNLKQVYSGKYFEFFWKKIIQLIRNDLLITKYHNVVSTSKIQCITNASLIHTCIQSLYAIYIIIVIFFYSSPTCNVLITYIRYTITSLW